MKTADAFFMGFPSYWSTVALYMFWLRPDPTIAVLMVVIPAILTFIPTRYLYPSKNEILWRTSWLLGIIWFALVTYLLMQDQPDPRLIWLSVYYPVYYLAASFYIDWRLRRSQKPIANGQ
jgi:phosphatidylcholine synthase